MYMPGPSAAMPAPSDDVEAQLWRMSQEPTGLSRPLVILEGWLMTGGGRTVAKHVKTLTGADDDDILLEWYVPGSGPEPLVRRAIRHIEARWPSDDPNWTVEVDVIGYSIGGVLARLAALPPRPGDPPRKRLRIRQLLTLSSPHRGTVGVGAFPIDATSRAVRGGSDLLQYLDAHQDDVDYELVCYCPLHDELVSAANAAPPDHGLIWTDGPLLGHTLGPGNRRFLADIALRLRGEPPLGRPAPLP